MSRRWSQKQAEVVRSLYENPERFTLVYGAVGSGKTAAACASMVVWSTTVRNEIFGVVAKTTSQTKDVILPEIAKACAELGVAFQKKDSQRYQVGRNMFRTFDGNDVTAIERIQGYNLIGLYVDEVVNMPEMILMEFDNRLRAGREQRAIFTANPGNPAHWFKKSWVDRAEDISLRPYRLLMADNPGLSERFVESTKLTSQGGFYQRRVLGEWANLDGNVYLDFREPAEAPDFREATEWYIAVDPAEASVCHALLVGLFGDTYWIYDEWRHHHGNQGQLSHIDMAVQIGQWLEKRDITVRAGVCDSAAQAFRRELMRRTQIAIAPVRKSPTRVLLDEIRLTQAWLASGRMRLSLNAPETFGEICSYAWDERAAEMGEDRPVKENDHAMDCMRYFTMTFARRPRGAVPTIRVR